MVQLGLQLSRAALAVGAAGVFGIAAAAGAAPSGAAPAQVSSVSSGTVYIADTNQSRVVVVPADGSAQTTIGSGLYSPYAVTSDAAGNVYIADTRNDRMVEVPADGSPQIVFSGWGPTGVAVDPAGDVFVSSDSLDDVVKISADLDHFTPLNLTLNHPRGIALDAAGNLFVADEGNNRVVELPASGGPQSTIASGLNFPNGVAVDSAGNVLIADTSNNQVVEVPADGGPQTTIGSGLLYPSAVALDAAGNVFIADQGRDRVVEVPTDGGPQTTVGSGLNGPRGVWVSAPPPVFTEASPPTQAAQGVPYSFTYAASTPAGEPAARFRIASGTLPPGLSLDAASGALSGTPTTPGTYTFTAETINAATGTFASPATITVTPRQDPSITAAVSSTRPKTASGWYTAPVTVTFTCTTHGSELTEACPAPAQLTGSGAGQSVTRTITAADGGTATVTVSGIDIDLGAPTLSVAGVRNGATYVAAPKPVCRAADAVSGPASCRVTSKIASRQALSAVYAYRAVALDRAGNRNVATGRYRLLTAVFTGAAYGQGAFTVHPGRAYTLIVDDSKTRPVYYPPAVAPKTPIGPAQKLAKAGPRRWMLLVTLPRSLRDHPLWDTGIKINGVMHILRIRIA